MSNSWYHGDVTSIKIWMKYPDRLNNYDRILFNYLDLTYSDYFLDIGAGNGRFTKNSINNVAFTVALDLNRYMVRRLKALFYKYPNVDVVNASMSSLPFRNSCFHKVLNVHNMWYVPKRLHKRVYAEVHRVSKDGAIYVTDMINHLNFRNLILWIINRVYGLLKRRPSSQNFSSMKFIINCLKDLGFDILKVLYVVEGFSPMSEFEQCHSALVEKSDGLMLRAIRFSLKLRVKKR